MDALAVELPPQVIEDFCKKWKITEFAVFGSALGNRFNPGSDLDVLVTFAEDSQRSLLDVIRAEQELAELVGRPVDLVERSSVEQTENWIRKNSILSSARTIYGG